MNRHRFDFWILAHRSFVAVCLACSLACWCDLARSQVQQQGGVQQGVQQGGQQGGQQAGGQQGVGNNGNQAGAGGVVIDARGVLRVNAVLDAGLSRSLDLRQRLPRPPQGAEAFPRRCCN